MKKILNIFASIILITAGASTVVACGSNPPPSFHDQQIVKDITNRLNNKTFLVDEIQNKEKTFDNYKPTVLKDIQSKLTSQEKSLVTFSSNDDNIKLGTKNETLKPIAVDIKSHEIQSKINIFVNLNHDAQQIADKLDTKTITVYNPQPGSSGDFTTLAPISAYQSQIENSIHQLIISKGIKINYGISFNWKNPYTDLIDNLSWVNDAIIGLTINIGTKDTSLPIFIRVKLAFNNNYEQQKKDIDDPSVGSKSTPQQINTADTTVQPGDWQKDGIKDLLDDSWNFGDFHKYVDYKPTMISNGWEYNQQTKQYERIRNQVTMYCPLLGKTRTFWVVVK